MDNLYDHQWEKYRIRFLKYNPRCYACGQQSTVVDHLVPHKGDVSLFWKLDNMIPLCAPCHNTITTLFDRYHKPGESIDEKLGHMAHLRERRELDFRVRVVPREMK